MQSDPVDTRGTGDALTYTYTSTSTSFISCLAQRIHLKCHCMLPHGQNGELFGKTIYPIRCRQALESKESRMQLDSFFFTLEMMSMSWNDVASACLTMMSICLWFTLDTLDVQNTKHFLSIRKDYLWGGERVFFFLCVCGGVWDSGESNIPNRNMLYSYTPCQQLVLHIQRLEAMCFF